MQRPTDTNGFTLVELAVSLVVIGLLIGLGTAMVGPLMSAIKVRESRENLGAAVESVNGWAAGNNRLPQWGDGVADATTDEFVEVARNSADAWTRPFIYLFDANLFTTAPTKDTICGRRSTALTLNTTDPAATITNVAYVVLSQGDNAETDTKIGTTAVTPGPITAATTVIANTSDDLVRWVTLDELRTKVGCQGPQLRIVNNELPYGSLSSPYPDVYVVADGGLGSSNYQWCIETAVASAPAALSFRQNTAAGAALTTIFSTDCATHTTWGTAEKLVVNGTPATGGSHYFKIFVRDGTGSSANNANKPFVLTINP